MPGGSRDPPGSPGGGLIAFSPGFVQLHGSLGGFAQVASLGRGYDGFAIPHFLISGHKQRLRLSVSLLAEKAVAQETPRVEPIPVIGEARVPDRESRAKQRFRLGPLLLLEQNAPEFRQRVSNLGVLGTELLFPRSEDIASMVSARAELPRAA